MDNIKYSIPQPFSFLQISELSVSSEFGMNEKCNVVSVNPINMIQQVNYKSPNKKFQVLKKLNRLEKSITMYGKPENAIKDCLEFCITRISSGNYSLTQYGVETLNSIKKYVDFEQSKYRIMKQNFGENLRSTIDIIMGESDGNQ